MLSKRYFCFLYKAKYAGVKVKRFVLVTYHDTSYFYSHTVFFLYANMLNRVCIYLSDIAFSINIATVSIFVILLLLFFDVLFFLFQILSPSG